MTFDTAIVVATVILAMTLLITIVVVSRPAPRGPRRYRRRASMRGWTFQRAREEAGRRAAIDGHHRRRRVESRNRSRATRAAGRAAPPRRRRRVTRWRTRRAGRLRRARPSPDRWSSSGAPKGRGQQYVSGRTSRRRVGRQARAEGGRLRIRQVNRRLLWRRRRVAPLMPVQCGASKTIRIPGYVVMAGNPRRRGTGLLFQGLSGALHQRHRELIVNPVGKGSAVASALEPRHRSRAHGTGIVG